MLEAYSRAWTEIDYDAIAHNVEEVRKRAVPASDKYDVVFLGRLSEEKDPLRFVELCCLIHSKNPRLLA